MTNEESNSALKLFIVLSRAHKVIHECSNQFFQENGLNPTEFAVLDFYIIKENSHFKKLVTKFC